MNLGSKTAKVPQDTKKRGTVINNFQKPHDFSLQFKQNTLIKNMTMFPLKY